MRDLLSQRFPMSPSTARLRLENANIRLKKSARGVVQPPGGGGMGLFTLEGFRRHFTQVALRPSKYLATFETKRERVVVFHR
jgi:hypothetical protein